MTKYTFIRTHTATEKVLVEADSIEAVKEGDYEELDYLWADGDDYSDDETTIELYTEGN